MFGGGGLLRMLSGRGNPLSAILGALSSLLPTAASGVSAAFQPVSAGMPGYGIGEEALSGALGPTATSGVGQALSSAANTVGQVSNIVGGLSDVGSTLRSVFDRAETAPTQIPGVFSPQPGPAAPSPTEVLRRVQAVAARRQGSGVMSGSPEGIYEEAAASLGIPLEQLREIMKSYNLLLGV